MEKPKDKYLLRTAYLFKNVKTKIMKKKKADKLLKQYKKELKQRWFEERVAARLESAKNREVIGRSIRGLWEISANN